MVMLITIIFGDDGNEHDSLDVFDGGVERDRSSAHSDDDRLDAKNHLQDPELPGMGGKKKKLPEDQVKQDVTHSG